MVTAFGQSAAPDLILYNGKIFTSNEEHPYVQAIAIRGERIGAVDDSKTIMGLAGRNTKLLDLGERTVIPGINDAHYHLSVTPKDELDLDLATANPSLDQIRAAIASAIPKAQEGTIIVGEIGESAYFDTALNRSLLDKWSPHSQVVLFTVSAHAAILNSAALTRFNIHDGDADPMGGRYERSSDGRLTGVLREYAALSVEHEIGGGSDGFVLKELGSVLSQAAKSGVTTIQDMSGDLTPEQCLALLSQIPSPIRIRIIRMPASTSRGRNVAEGLSVLHIHSGLVTVSGTKWVLDGTPLEGTFASRQAQAKLFAEINHPGISINSMSPLERFLSTQQLTFPNEQMTAMLDESLKVDDQLLVHVNGYPAAKSMLDAMQADGGREVWFGRRVRFEHGHGLFGDLISRVKELGVIVVQNPRQLAWKKHFTHDLGFVQAQPLKALLTAGIPVALGSDLSGDVNPFLDIMLATTHPDRPAEAITREQAVIAYTLTSAYAEFTEKDKGSLEPGKLADLAVLSQDIFSVPTAELPKTQSVLTLVGGKTVYDAGVVR
ncbi:MAG: amidohydrolase family protein [Thermoplasmata archaeon]